MLNLKIAKIDFVLMYAIAIICVLVMGALSLAIGTNILMLLVLVIPGTYYFWKNKTDMKSASIISALFGFTIFLAYLLFFVAPMGLILSMLANAPLDYTLLFTQINWGRLFLELIGTGLMISVMTLMGYGIATYLNNKKL